MSILRNKYERETNNLNNYLDLIEFISKAHGDKAAYIDKDITKTFIDVEKDVKSTANYFINSNIVDEKIALLGKTSYEYYVIYLAISLSGNTVIPIDKTLKTHEILNLLEMSKTKYVCMDSSIEENKENTIKEYCKNSNGVARNISNVVISAIPNMETKNFNLDINRTSTIIFTSGTTSTAKGVMLTQKNIVSNVKNSIGKMEFTTEDIAMTVLPINHAFGFTTDLVLLTLGITNYINDSLANFVNNLKEYSPTTMSLVPLVVENMMKQIKKAIVEKNKTKKVERAIKISNFLLKLHIDVRRILFKEILESLGGRLRFIQCGGAPLSKEIVDFFYSIGIYITQGYGITECSPVVSINMSYECKKNVGSVGRPIPNVEVKIVEDEILVKGPNVMKGYYNDEEATKEAFTEDGWFKTGDLGYIDENNFIYITGRKKNLIILDNGKNVYPEELEEYLQKIDGVLEVAVYESKKLITAEIYKEKDVSEELIEEKIEEVNNSLPHFKRIQRIKFRRNEFEKTALKKIKRGSLNKNNEERKYVAPRTELEEKLCKEFSEVLDVPQVGIEDNFFELGGDSLSAVQITLFQYNDIAIEMEDVYQNPTVKKLAAKMSLKEEEIVIDENINKLLTITNKEHISHKIKNILLTGATGYLGSHILKELLEYDVNIYCLVRDKNRLINTLEYYFSNLNMNKINIIQGDITDKSLGLSEEVYNYLIQEIDTVVHVAANVKHAENYDVMYKINVEGTINVAEFCKKSNAVMHHTSTASLHGSGVTRQTNSNFVFNESVLNVGQQIKDNVYINTKYQAEEYVINERVNGNLKANIYRIGNLTWRQEDKVFQKNALENGFLNRIKGIMQIGVVSEEILKYPIDFTAVDECAKAYVKIIMSGDIQNIYNLYNPNILTLKDIAYILNLKLNLVDRKTFEQILKDNINSKEVKVLSFYYSLARKSENIKVENDYTVETLKKLNFEFSKLDKNYLEF